MTRRADRAAEPRRRRLRPRLVEVADRDPGAARGELRRRFQPDPAGPAGHDDDRSVQLELAHDLPAETSTQPPHPPARDVHLIHAMNVPIQIRYHGMDTSDALSDHIREQAEKLTRVYGRIERVEVVLEQPQKRHRHGDRFHVRIHVHVPGNDIIIDRDPGDDAAHEIAQAAVRDAFDAARRRLDEHADRLRAPA